MYMQYTRENRVESSHPQFIGNSSSDKFRYAFAHLACSLVGKRQCKYSPWFKSMSEKMHYFICQHSGLAGSGTRYDKLRAVDIHDGLTLLVIKSRQIVVHQTMSGIYLNWFIASWY